MQNGLPKIYTGDLKDHESAVSWMLQEAGISKKQETEVEETAEEISVAADEFVIRAVGKDGFSAEVRVEGPLPTMVMLTQGKGDEGEYLRLEAPPGRTKQEVLEWIGRVLL